MTHVRGTFSGSPFITAAATDKNGSHFDFLGVGGLAAVLDRTELHAIPVNDPTIGLTIGDQYSSGRRRVGMERYIISEGVKVRLVIPGYAAMSLAAKYAALSSNAYWVTVVEGAGSTPPPDGVTPEMVQQLRDEALAKPPAEAATTEPVDLTGAAHGAVIDGVNLTPGDAAVLAGQADGVENGVYTLATEPTPAAVTNAGGTASYAVTAPNGTALDGVIAVGGLPAGTQYYLQSDAPQGGAGAVYATEVANPAGATSNTFTGLAAGVYQIRAVGTVNGTEYTWQQAVRLYAYRFTRAAGWDDAPNDEVQAGTHLAVNSGSNAGRIFYVKYAVIVGTEPLEFGAVTAGAVTEEPEEPTEPALLLTGRHYKIIEAGPDATANGTALLAAYAGSPPLDQSLADNRYTILLTPGRYTLPAGALVLNKPFVDIVGLDQATCVLHAVGGAVTTFGLPAQGNPNFRLQRLTLLAGVNAVCYAGPTSNYTGGGDQMVDVTFHCLEDVDGSGQLTSGTYFNGGYRRLLVGNDSARSDLFGGTGTVCGGTFIDCTVNHIGLIACRAFGGLGTASGKFINCRVERVGSSAEFTPFGGKGTASGRFERCAANGPNNYAFGGGTGGVASGVFTDCQALAETTGLFAFGGGGGTASGRFEGCRAEHRAGTFAVTPFGGGAGATCTGVFINCTAVALAGSVNISGAFGGLCAAAGTFINCQCTGVAACHFGGNPANNLVGSATGIFLNCAVNLTGGGVDYSFAGNAPASGYFKDCSVTAKAANTLHSFGAGLATAALASGNFANCTVQITVTSGTATARAFGYGGGGATGSFTGCQVRVSGATGGSSQGFGGNGASASGYFKDCSVSHPVSALGFGAGNNGGGLFGSATGVFINCSVDGTTTVTDAIGFASTGLDSSSQCSGQFYNCRAGQGFDAATITGIFIDCQIPYVLNGLVTGTYRNCRLGNVNSGGVTAISNVGSGAYFENCIFISSVESGFGFECIQALGLETGQAAITVLHCRANKTLIEPTKVVLVPATDTYNIVHANVR